MTIAQLLVSKEAIAVYALALAAIEKKFQFIKPAVKYAKAHDGVLKTLEQDVAGLIKSPAVAATEAHLKMELDAEMKKVEASTLGKLAAEAVAGIGKMGKSLSQLSPEELNAVAIHIETTAQTLGFNLSKQAITDALNVAEAAATAIPNVPVIATAAKFASEVAAAQTAPAKA